MTVRLEMEKGWPHSYEREEITTGKIAPLYWPIRFCPEDMPTALYDHVELLRDPLTNEFFVEVGATIHNGNIYLQGIRSANQRTENGLVVIREVKAKVETEALAQKVWNESTEVDSDRPNRMRIRRFAQGDHRSGGRMYTGYLVLPEPLRK